jgi:hypothetical protein
VVTGGRAAPGSTMQPYIGRWDCRYRVAGAQPEAAAAVALLERNVRGRVPDAYIAALEGTLQNDPTVYVLRRLHVALSLRVGEIPNEPALAQRWARHLGAATVRKLVADGANPADIVRFADDAEYVAHFMADLLNDLAWQRWYYGAFSRYRHAAKREAVLGVLLENSRELVKIFRCLAQLGCLRAVLDLLGPSEAGTLWREAVQPDIRQTNANELRVFVRAALAIIESSKLWARAPFDVEALLTAYAETHPPLPDWTDRRSLALAVVHVLRFVAWRGVITAPRGANAERYREGLAGILATLDWLDTRWLEDELCAWFAEDAVAAPFTERSESDLPAPLRPSGLRASDATEFRIFVRAALAIIESSELWAKAPLHGEALLIAYAETHPPLPDWTDQRSLALAVVHVLRFAARRGAIIAPHGANAERYRERLAAVLATLDWLDTQWLEDELCAWSAEDAVAVPLTEWSESDLSASLRASDGLRASDATEFRIFVRAALAIIEAVELWAEEPLDGEALLTTYAETHPPLPDRTDRRSLALAVVQVLRFTARRGAIIAPHGANAERYRERLTAVLATLDWLDTRWLEDTLCAWFAEDAVAAFTERSEFDPSAPLRASDGLRASDATEFRVFVRAALAIIEAVELWAEEPLDGEALLTAYAETHPPLPDWTDRRSLALAVVQVLRFTARRGAIIAPRGAVAERYRERLTAVLRTLDWLDTRWLEDALCAWFAEDAVALPLTERSEFDLRAPLRPSGLRASEATEFRIFVRAALAIIEAAELWAEEPLDEEALLTAYAGTHPPLPDWTDRRSLALAVVQVVRFTARRGAIIAPRGVNAERYRERLAAVLAPLEWLDTRWLEDALRAWFAEDAVAVPFTERSESDLPARLRPAGLKASATPMQRRLLERLHALLYGGLVALDHREPDSPSNALRIYAALAAAEPEMALQPATSSTIALLLTCWKALLDSAEPLAVMERLRKVGSSGEFDAASGVFDESTPPVMTAAFRAAAALGEPAADVLHELLTRRPIGLASTAHGTIETSCAGLFLLLRAVTDARLPQLVSKTGAGPLASILLAVGIQWAGAPAVRDGEPDAGLAFWSGLAEGRRPVAAILDALDPRGCDALLAAIEDLMRDRAALDPALVVAGEVPADGLGTLAEAWPAAIPISTALALVAVHVLRLWARWLPGIGSSGVPYLLKNLIRRSGRIEVRRDAIDVVLRPAPLDVVLEMSGSLAEVPAIPWLENRKVTLRIDRGTT